MDRTVLIIDTHADEWEAVTQGFINDFGQTRRSPLDSTEKFMLETERPVILDGVYVMMGQWPVPALVEEVPNGNPV